MGTVIPSAGTFPLEVAFMNRIPPLELEFASPVTDVAFAPIACELFLILVPLLRVPPVPDSVRFS